MLTPSFVVAVLRPEIASGAYAFAHRTAPSEQVARPPDGGDGAGDTSQVDEATAQSEPPLHSSIPGVSALEAALLLPSGQILPHVFARAASAGFRVREQRAVLLTKSQARALYTHERLRLDDDDAFCAFLESITCGLSRAVLLELPDAQSASDAVVRWHEVVGIPDPVVARQDALSASLPHDEWPLHALCGLDAVQNGIQSSATFDCAVRERALLLPTLAPSLERAVVVLLPSFTAALPEGRALLLTKLHAAGVLVSTLVDVHHLDAQHELAALANELHPTTIAEHRDEFALALQKAVSAGTSCLLELEALDLAAKLRDVIGPASVEAARLYFPDSVRAQLPASLMPVVAHVRSREGTSTGLETGLFVTLDGASVAALLARHTSHSIEHTFALIKPGTANDCDAVRAIQDAIRAFGFSIDRQRRLQLTRAQAAAFYSEHRGKPFFERLLAFMTSGELVAMQLTRRNAVATWRALMGPTNVLHARISHPHSLRARFGIDGTRNATHGSDAIASADRELKFVFGNSARKTETTEIATSSNLTVVTLAKTIAQQPLLLPYARDTTLEKVLTLGLAEMLAHETSPIPTQLDACTWLGNWLLAYAQKQQERGDDGSDSVSATHYSSKCTPMIARGRQKPLSAAVVVDPVQLRFRANRTLVAIAYAHDVAAPLRAAVNDVLRALAMPAFVVIDAAAVLMQHADDPVAAAATLAQQLGSAGKRRVVLLSLDVTSATHIERLEAAQSEWRINAAVTVRSSSDTEAPATALHPLVPHAVVELPSQQQLTLDVAQNTRFSALFSRLFRPSVVVVHDTSVRIDSAAWRSIAAHCGAALLVFDDLVRACIERERDPNGAFTQLERTRATAPPELLLSLVSDAIHRFEPTRVSDVNDERATAQRFVLCGFPLAAVRPNMFEQRVGRIARVLYVRSSTTHDRELAAPWIAHAAARGALTELWGGTQELRESCERSFGPAVGLYVDETSDKHCNHAQVLREAQAQGYAVINVCELAGRNNADILVGQLERVLLRTGGFDKVFVRGFPAAADALQFFIDRVLMPRFVVFTAASNASPELLAVLDAFPQIVQLDLAHARYTATDTSSSSAVTAVTVASALRSVLFGKRLSFAVGDVAVLDAARLRESLAALGVSVLDLRSQQQQQQQQQQLETAALSPDDGVRELVAHVQMTATPRCLVLGASEHVQFFQALEAAVGNSAVNCIVVLKHVEREAPVARAAKRDGDDEDYYSDDEDELERQRQQRARTALPAHLDELLQHYAGKSRETSSAILATRLNFVDASTVYDVIRRQLAPQLLGVIGHPHTFYEQALRACARRRALAVISTRWWLTLDDDSVPLAAPPHWSDGGSGAAALARQVAALQRLVAATPCAAYVLDGFPRAVASGAAPYVAQQLAALERVVAPLRTLVHFTASTDVLAERVLVSRNALEDAQDVLEAATCELIALVAARGARHAVLSVTCERELGDVEEELDDALQRAGVRL